MLALLPADVVRGRLVSCLWRHPQSDSNRIAGVPRGAAMIAIAQGSKATSPPRDKQAGKQARIENRRN
jgi:hypothetical protein